MNRHWWTWIPGCLLAGRVLELDALAAATVEAVASGGSGPGPSTVPAHSLAVYLGLAFLGGLILNIMPCVLPVISLKILGFVNQGRESPARVRQLGLVYCLGVVFSFLVVAGVAIALGRKFSWGIQFQNPQFLVIMTTLLVLAALNLFGAFEVTLSSTALTTASQMSSKEGFQGAFFNGLLATALATSCSAPFLGSALGFAVLQPPLTVVLMFTAIGLGLCFPHLVLSLQPAWLRFLPKPGPWMARFKVVMGFPMLGTAIWLFVLAVPHFGKWGAFWLGEFLVIIALAAWMWGEFVQRSRGPRWAGIAAACVVALAGYGFVLEGRLQWRSHGAGASAGGTASAFEPLPGGIAWQPWSLAAVAHARAAGRPVLVDFTADWCFTCQANKTTSIEIPAVRAKLKQIDATALLGDYTMEDDAITEELKRFGKAAVPLVLVYPKDPQKPPLVLPTVLTPGIMLDALEKAAR